MKKTPYEILSGYGIQIKTEKGNDYITLCPFHDDKNPSFSIDKNKGIYQCWSCGVKGNLYTLVKNIEHISYDEAVKKINGDERLSTFVSFDNTFIKKRNKKIELDLKYYEFKYLLELLFYRDRRNLYLRKKLSVIKDEDEFKYILDIQRKLKNKQAGYNFNMKRSILSYIFEIVESYDSYRYCLKEYEDKKYEMLMDYLKYYNFQTEAEIILNLINNKNYIKLNKLQIETSKQLLKIYKVFKRLE